MPNATQLIRQDHKTVEGLFKQFEAAKGNERKRRIADQAMAELEVHAKIEEEIFYPAVRKEVGDEEMLDEAEREHQTVKDLISELKQMRGENGEFEAKFSELVKNVKHHVEEEQSEMLPQAEESQLNLRQLGEEMAERKAELLNKTRKNSAGAASRRKSKSARRGSNAKRAQY